MKSFKTDAEREAFESYLRNSQRLIDKFLEIIQEQIDSLEQTKLEDFDSASWSHKQAFKEGKKNSFQYVKQLFEIK